MIKSYFDKNKKIMFPEINDWKDPQNNLRFSDDVKHMDGKTWVFFHYTAYLIINYGYHASVLLTFGILSIYMIYTGIYFIAAILLFIWGHNLIGLIKKIKNHKNISKMNFYDLYMREY